MIDLLTSIFGSYDYSHVMELGFDGIGTLDFQYIAGVVIFCIFLKFVFDIIKIALKGVLGLV